MVSSPRHGQPRWASAHRPCWIETGCLPAVVVPANATHAHQPRAPTTPGAMTTYSQSVSPSVPPRGSGVDVLVQVEQVVRVVAALDLAQPVVVRAVVVAGAGLLVGRGEVDVPAGLGVRRGRRVVLPHPVGVALVVGPVGPHAGDDGGDGGVAVAVRRRAG